jgi:hypothetical protein
MVKLSDVLQDVTTNNLEKNLSMNNPSGKWTCPVCKKVWDGICKDPECGGILVQSEETDSFKPTTSGTVAISAVCTHCYWAGSIKEAIPALPNGLGPFCPKCDYVVSVVSNVSRIEVECDTLKATLNEQSLNYARTLTDLAILEDEVIELRANLKWLQDSLKITSYEHERGLSRLAMEIPSDCLQRPVVLCSNVDLRALRKRVQEPDNE